MTKTSKNVFIEFYSNLLYKNVTKKFKIKSQKKTFQVFSGLYSNNSVYSVFQYLNKIMFSSLTSNVLNNLIKQTKYAIHKLNSILQKYQKNNNI